MNSLKIKIMVKATKLRLGAGEKLENILNGWPALSKEDKNQIRSAVSA